MRWLAHLVAVLELAVAAVYFIHTGGVQGWSAGQAIPMVLITLAVGWLLASRLPRNPLGWLLLGIAGGFLLTVPFDLAGRALLDTDPGLAAWLLWYGADREDTWIWLPPVVLLFTQVPLRFPDGRLPSPRWAWFSRYTIAAIVVGSALFSSAGAEVAPGVPNPTHSSWVAANQWVIDLFGLLGLLPAALVAVGSLVVRYRRADGLQRTQIRWVAWAACLVLAAYLAALVIPEGTGYSGWVVLAYGLIPAAMGFAVLRYRLYDIDRIISRTVSYGVVTSLAVGAYVLVVTAASQLLPGQSSLGVAAATLVAAAVFLPALRFVRTIVDRRFDRERFDAQRTIDAFGEQLRTGAHPDQVADELGQVVRRVLGPASMGLWVKR